MKHLFSTLLIVFLLLPAVSLAITLQLKYPKFLGLDPNEFANDPDAINKLIAWFYYFIVTISGLAAFFMLVVGGFKFLTSAGDPGAMSEGKERIVHAIIGLLIIITSYLVLKTINPELVTLNLPTL